MPSQFLEKVSFLSQHLGEAHLPSLGLAAASLALLRLWPASWARVVPPQIAAVAAGLAVMTAASAAGLETGIDTIGSRFGAGAIPTALPLPHLPALPSPDVLAGLVSPAATIATLAAIESLLCCVVADGQINDKHNSNTELIAQGVANMASASIGGLPATGALARTAANIRCGGRSPVSGMVHALTVGGVMVTAGPAAGNIPLPALSAVLVVVAINMGEWKNFKAIRGWPAGDASVYLASFLLTVLTDVTVAVEAGLALSLLLAVRASAPPRAGARRSSARSRARALAAASVVAFWIRRSSRWETT